MNQSNEIWKPVVGYEGFYEVSNQGRVRSLDRDAVDITGRPYSVKGRIRKLKLDRKGYVKVALSVSNTMITYSVHTLVLEAFVGPKPNGAQCRHLNGNPADNRPSNLAWGTAKENMNDMKIHGTNPRWTATACKRGHDFTGRNVMPDAHGHRGCRACIYEKRDAHREGRPFSDELADALFSDIVAGKRVGPKRKLTAQQVIEIRDLYSQGFLQTDLAGLYGVSQPVISSILRRETWAWV